MECLRPVKIYLSDEERNRRYHEYGMPFEYRCATYIHVPCGKCEACAQKRKNEWTLRLLKEVENSSSCYFITLTYDDDNISYLKLNESKLVPTVNKKDIQDFLKRLRYQIQPFKIRYFVVSEYGPKFYRPHYHMLLFNFPHELSNKLDKILKDSWKNGFISVSPVTSGRISYVCSYCLDSSTLPEFLTKNFMLCSRKPGIGSSYLDNGRVISHHVNSISDECVISDHGEVYRYKMPRYYRDRIFDDEQKLFLAYKATEFHVDQRRKLVEDQCEWLRQHGYECSSVNIRTAFPSSPLDLYNQKRETFKRNIRKKCKMKKNG